MPPCRCGPDVELPTQKKNYKVELKKDKGTWRQQRAIALNKHMGEGMRFRNKMGPMTLSAGFPR